MFSWDTLHFCSSASRRASYSLAVKGVTEGAPREVHFNGEDIGVAELFVAFLVVERHGLDEPLQLEHDVLHWNTKRIQMRNIPCLCNKGFSAATAINIVAVQINSQKGVTIGPLLSPFAETLGTLRLVDGSF